MRATSNFAKGSSIRTYHSSSMVWVMERSQAQHAYCAGCNLFFSTENQANHVSCREAGCTSWFCSIDCRASTEIKLAHSCFECNGKRFGKDELVRVRQEYRIAYDIFAKFVCNALRGQEEGNEEFSKALSSQLSRFLVQFPVDDYDHRFEDTSDSNFAGKKRKCTDNDNFEDDDVFVMAVTMLSGRAEIQFGKDISNAILHCLTNDSWVVLLKIVRIHAIKLPIDCPIGREFQKLPTINNYDRRVAELNRLKQVLGHTLGLHFIDSFPSSIPTDVNSIELKTERQISLLALLGGAMPKNPLNSLSQTLIAFIPELHGVDRTEMPKCLIEATCGNSDGSFSMEEFSVQMIALVDLGIGEVLSLRVNSDYGILSDSTSRDNLERYIYVGNFAESITERFQQGNAYMQRSSFQSATEVYVSLLELYMQILREHNEGDDLGSGYHTVQKIDTKYACETCPWSDIYHALGSALVESGCWRDGHGIWCYGFKRFPENKYLSEAHIRMCSTAVYSEIKTSTWSAQVHGKYRILEIPKRLQVCADDYVLSHFRSNHSPIDIQKTCRMEDTVFKPPANQVSRIIVSLTSIVQFSECDWVIAEAERFASASGLGWTTSRHYAVPTTDLPVHAIPSVSAWFNRLLADALGPLIAASFAGSEKQCCNLCVLDAFIVRYSVPDSMDTIKTTQRYLPLHTDQSTHSMVLALNSCDEYDGGGTFFADLEDSIRCDKGQCAAFSGDLLHGGDPVLRGTRYILAMFFMVDFDHSEWTVPSGSIACQCASSTDESNFISSLKARLSKSSSSVSSVFGGRDSAEAKCASQPFFSFDFNP